ncbi:MAG: MFS transporter [Candidatus Nezhaarchaeota archaeon]|nr:MFS transporter [Candidatus Nezhaarchaeota archaeon]
MRRESMVLAASFSTAFMAYGVRYTFSMLLPEMMGELNLTNTQAGLMYTSFLTLYTVASVLVGFLVDVEGVKRTMLKFLPLFGLGTGLMSLTFSDWSGAIFFGIAGLGASACWTPLIVWVQKAYQFRRGLFLGVLQVGCNMGFGVLGVLIPLMLPHLGWRGCWAMLGVLSMAWLMPLIVMAHEPIIESTRERSLLKHVKGFKALLRSRQFWFGGSSYMLAAFAIMVPMTFTKAYANLELNVSSEAATALFTVIGFVGIAGSLLLPPLSDKLGRRSSILMCNSIMAIGLLGSMITIPSFTHIALWSAIIGLSYGAIWPLYAALIKDLYTWSVVGSIMGSWTMMCGIGLLLSPAVGGLITDVFSSYKPTYFMAFTTALASMVLTLPIKKIKLSKVKDN